MRSIEITGYKTFGVKRFCRICKDDKITLYNVFGFGLWVYPNSKDKRYIKQLRKERKNASKKIAKKGGQ